VPKSGLRFPKTPGICPNEKYFAYADWVIKEADDYGITHTARIFLSRQRLRSTKLWLTFACSAYSTEMNAL
jgi:hypothetical protein